MPRGTLFLVLPTREQYSVDRNKGEDQPEQYDRARRVMEQPMLRSAYVCGVIIVATDASAVLSAPIGRVASVAVGSAIGVGGSWVFEKTEVLGTVLRVT